MGNPYLVAVTANTVTDAINEMFNDEKTGCIRSFWRAALFVRTLREHCLNRFSRHDIIFCWTK